MPLYEYKCLDCSETFQLRRTFDKATAVAECPSCTSERTRKLLAEFMMLSGSGSMKSLDTASPSGDPMMGGGCCGGACGCSH